MIVAGRHLLWNVGRCRPCVKHRICERVAPQAMSCRMAAFTPSCFRAIK